MDRTLVAGVFRPALRGTDHSLKEYTTEPYVSLASGTISRTISTYFRDARNKMHVLCIDVVCRHP